MTWERGPLEEPGASSESPAAFAERVRSWLAANVRPLPPGADPRAAMVSDERDRFSGARAVQRLLFEAGLAGLSFPVEYGGCGLGPEYQQVLNDESAGYDMPVRFRMPTLGIIAPTILELGTEEQKRRYIPAMLRGDELWVQMLSEPGCGSDLAGAVTRATRDGDRWVLTGAKVWSSAAYACDFAVCLARTNWDVPKHRGLTMFVVPLGAPGIDLTRIRQADGSAEFCQEFFDDVLLGPEAVLGEVDGGWSVASRLLHHERQAIGGGSPFIGHTGERSSQGADPRLVALAAATGRSADRRIRQLVAEGHVLAEVRSQLVARVRAGTRRGDLPPTAGSLLKLFTATSSARLATIAAEVAGPAAVVGLPERSPAGGATGGDPASVEELARAGRDVVVRQRVGLAGGSNEMQRNIISERLLGMPRELAADRDVPFSEVPRSRVGMGRSVR